MATASVVVLRGSGRTMPNHHRVVLGEVLAMATLSVRRKTVTSRGRTSSCQPSRVVLVALVLVLRGSMSTPAPSALEGRLVPILVETPRHSLQTSALGDLQTGCTRLGAIQCKSSLRLDTQHVHCKVPCNVQPLTARSPHTSAHFQNNAQNHSTHNTRQMFDLNRRPYATERLLFTQTLTATQWHTRSSSCSVPVSVRAGRVDA